MNRKANRPIGLRFQKGIGMGYLLMLIVLVTLVSSFMMKNSASLSGTATDAQYLTAANELDRAANELSVRMAQLRMTYGASIAVRITNGQFVSPTSAFPALSVPPLPASASMTSWRMSENDRLTVPVTGDSLSVALTDVTNPVCQKFNATHIRAVGPVLASAVNGFGGNTYSISNPGTFNGGSPATLFCVEGAGASGQGLLILGFMSN